MYKLRQFIKNVLSTINDPERDFSERVFVLFTIISFLTMLIALAGDIITGENPFEIVTLFLASMGVPLITFTCLYFNKLKTAIRIIVALLVFIILPAVFFFGGGVEGGGVLWFIFAFLYIGLVISGIW
nr:hypothetical protein [Lachnospiraceae bacterium]